MQHRIILCITLFLVFMSGCAEKKYTYADVGDNRGFEMQYIDEKAVYLDYDFAFKVTLPTDTRLLYSYEYDDPDLSEGAPLGRTSLRIYYPEDGEAFDRNIIEIKATLVGTREWDDFAVTATVEIPDTDKSYAIEEYDDGIRILSESLMGENHCIKADLSKTAYHDLREELEEMICSAEFLKDDDPYFQEFAHRKLQK